MTSADDPARLWREIALAAHGPDYARTYAACFDRAAHSGGDMHGEANLVSALAGPGASVLDAGCGTGRVAARLAELGHEVVGVDVDSAMVDVARERHPALSWHVADLAALVLGRVFDAVVAAGNVVPLAGASRVEGLAVGLATHARPGGVVVCGFGLDADHLPGGAEPVALEQVESAWRAAGLELAERWAGWDATPYDGGGYVVLVHRRIG